MRVWNPEKTKLSRNPFKCSEQSNAELLQLILKIREGLSDLTVCPLNLVSDPSLAIYRLGPERCSGDAKMR